MKSLPIILLLGGAGLIAGCKKDVVSKLDTIPTPGQANIKIVHASAYTTNYTVQLKVNDVRVSSALTYSTPFPGGGLNTGGASSPWYLSVAPGTNKISLAVPKVNTAIDSLALFSGAVNVEANKYYSAYLADTSFNTQIVLVPENLAAPANNTSRFKFVNLMPNAALDLYWGTNKVAANIPFKGVSADFSLNRADTTHWYIRLANAASTSTPVAMYPTTGASIFTVPNQRIMTVFSRGYSGATGNRAPNVSLLYN